MFVSSLLLPTFDRLSVVCLSAAFCAVLVRLLFRRFPSNATGNVVPPGPRLRYAFLRRYPERSLHAWAAKYGPLFSVQMGSQLVVVISHTNIARDLLVTNGSIFSSRKPYFMKNQTILRGRAITASEYNQTWRKHRRLAMQLLTHAAVVEYASVFQFEAATLIHTLYRDSEGGKKPINPAKAAGRFALNNMLTVSFGMRTDSIENQLVERALELAMEFMDLTGPWSNAIDFIELIQYLPTRMRTRGHKLHDDLISVYGQMIADVERRLEKDESDVPDCLVRTLLGIRDSEKLDHEDICMLSAVFTLGGVHSTFGLIQWFIAVMANYGIVQRTAQSEIDTIVGRDRMPTAMDEPQLQYVRSVIKEVQRLHAPFWMATPHYSTEDFVYQGMYIPKHTLVVLNCYTIHHDPIRYPNPDEFDPSRYADDTLSCTESAKLPDAMKRDHWTFGAGRRICPGMTVAERELWLAISGLLWAFDISAVPGEPVSLEEYEGLSGRTPIPFRAYLRPRHVGVGEVLQKELEQ
ncbi:Isoflavone 2'-hydroxylase [Leucoagaricus sp. SymC.cos]|nr:Isoflavone 2'-hydroxylase [Leucoagaricus sp. SymC.cos]